MKVDTGLKFAQGLPDNSSLLCDKNDQGKYPDQMTTHSATNREPLLLHVTGCLRIKSLKL